METNRLFRVKTKQDNTLMIMYLLTGNNKMKSFVYVRKQSFINEVL